MYTAMLARLIEFVRGQSALDDMIVVESQGFQTIPDSAGLTSSLPHTQVFAPTGLIHRSGIFKCLTFVLRRNPLVSRLIRTKKGRSMRDQDEIEHSRKRQLLDDKETVFQ